MFPRIRHCYPACGSSPATYTATCPDCLGALEAETADLRAKVTRLYVERAELLRRIEKLAPPVRPALRLAEAAR